MSKFDSIDVFLVALFLVGVGAIILCSFIVIGPYLTENAFLAANCTVQNVTYHGNYKKQRSNDGCVIINVSYSYFEDTQYLYMEMATWYSSTDMLNHKVSLI